MHKRSADGRVDSTRQFIMKNHGGERRARHAYEARLMKAIIYAGIEMFAEVADYGAENGRVAAWRQSYPRAGGDMQINQ